MVAHAVGGVRLNRVAAQVAKTGPAVEMPGPRGHYGSDQSPALLGWGGQRGR